MNIKTIGIFLIILSIWLPIIKNMLRGMFRSGCRTMGCTCDCPCCNPHMPKSILKKRPKYVVYGTSRCGYTVKLLDEIEEMDTAKEFEYKDITKAENRKEYEKLGVEGVPVTVSVQDPEKVVVGYRPFGAMLKALR